jgi:hypothetical protein
MQDLARPNPAVPEICAASRARNKPGKPKPASPIAPARSVVRREIPMRRNCKQDDDVGARSPFAIPSPRRNCSTFTKQSFYGKV